MDHKEIDFNTRNQVDSGQDKDYWRALMNVALNLPIPQAMEFVKDIGLAVNIGKHNYIQKEIKCRPKAENSCYYSVQTLLPSRLPSKRI